MPQGGPRGDFTGGIAEGAASCAARHRAACRRRQAEALQRLWLTRLAFGPQPEQAAEIQLWLGLFPVSWQQLPDAALLEQQIATIRQHMGGSFTGLLTAMVRDPALQLSLNGPANHRGNPNENLARELLELFSFGEAAPSVSCPLPQSQPAG